jgi:hypothetical protein
LLNVLLQLANKKMGFKTKKKTSSSIPNVSERDVCGKTQHLSLKRCSVADILKYNKPTTL